MMSLVVGLLAYLAAVVAIVSGAAAVLSSTSEPGASKASVRPEPIAMASPRIQAWLERKAEGVAFGEKRKAAEQAERERADALRAKLATTETPPPTLLPPPSVASRIPEAEDRKVAKRERAARVKENGRREARRRLRDLEARTAYSYAPEPQRPSYAEDFLTMRDRYGY
jgi:hypothetical protein